MGTVDGGPRRSSRRRPTRGRAGLRRWTAIHLLGLAKVNGKVKILLEIGRVLSSQDLSDLAPIIQ